MKAKGQRGNGGGSCAMNGGDISYCIKEQRWTKAKGTEGKVMSWQKNQWCGWTRACGRKVMSWQKNDGMG